MHGIVRHNPAERLTLIVTMENRPWKIILAAVVTLLLLHAAPNPAAAGRVFKKSILIGRIDRTYELFLPAAYSSNASFPLVIVLHGSSANGSFIGMYTGFSECAEREHFIAAYPDSYGTFWNDGRIDRASKSFLENVDDVEFISRLIDHCAARYDIDRERIYIAGFSNGGMMAQRLGITIPEKLAAIATVSGPLPKHLALFAPRTPVPVMIIHGTRDRVVPWPGGRLGRGRNKHGDVLSVLDTVVYWSKNNGLSIASPIQILPDIDPGDETTAYQVCYGCSDPVREVSLIAIQGGGHTWPGAKHSVPGSIMGKTSGDINATEVIWNFFSRHWKRKSRGN